MITSRINFRPQILVIFLVALSLLFAGVRVPDLSRPHRPKATHRTVLETQHKIVSKCLKQQQDFVSCVPLLVASGNVISYNIPDVVSPLYASPLPPSTLGRSPPDPQS